MAEGFIRNNSAFSEQHPEDAYMNYSWIINSMRFMITCLRNWAIEHINDYRHIFD